MFNLMIFWFTNSHAQIEKVFHNINMFDGHSMGTLNVALDITTNFLHLEGKSVNLEPLMCIYRVDTASLDISIDFIAF